MIVSSSGRLYDSALFWRHRSPVTFNPFLCCTLVLDFGGLFLCAILSSILSRDSFQNATILKAKTSYLRYRKVEKSYLNRIPFFRSGIMPAGHWMPKEKKVSFSRGAFFYCLSSFTPEVAISVYRQNDTHSVSGMLDEICYVRPSYCPSKAKLSSRVQRSETVKAAWDKSSNENLLGLHVRNYEGEIANHTNQNSCIEKYPQTSLIFFKVF